MNRRRRQCWNLSCTIKWRRPHLRRSGQVHYSTSLPYLNPALGAQWERLLFSVAPVGHLTLQGFLSKWNYFMLLDPKSCLKQILYLGFNNDMISSLYTLSKHKRQERRETLTRSIIQCWVFGSKGCGKSTFLKALVGPDEMQKVQENNGINEGDDYIAVDLVSLNNSSSKTLVLHEANPAQTEQLLDDVETAERVNLESIDVAVFLYSADNAKSFLEAKRLMLQISEAAGDHLPCLLICTKSELDLHQETIKNVKSTCEELKLREPISISAKTGELHSIYKVIINAALKPSVDMVPETSARRHVRMRRLWTRRLLTVGLVGTTAALVAIYVWPKLKSRNFSSTKEVTEITK